LAKVFIDFCHRKPHDVVVAAFDAADAYHAYPLLDTIGSSLVVGAIVVYIVGQFALAQRTEEDIGLLSEGDCFSCNVVVEVMKSGVMRWGWRGQ
jgi:hypothetical protein